MRPAVRIVIGLAVAGAVFAALAGPSLDLSLVARRESYRAAERLGIMTTGGPLGGQIKGFNYQRAPAWVHPVAEAIGSAVGFAPGLVLVLLAYHRIVYGPYGATLCGRCGSVLRRLTRAACPRCGSDL